MSLAVNGSSAIVCLFPRGEAIRNFAYGGALEMLQAQRGCAALSVKPNEQIWQHLASRCRDLRSLEEFHERYPVRILREVLDMAHGRWLWSEAAQERWRLRDAEAITANDKLKRWGKKVVATPLSSRAGLNLLSRTERAASRALNPTKRYLDLFREWQPSLVFNASHVHSRNAIQAVQSAQWLGIPTATFIFSWDNLTSQGRVLPPYDYYLVWNETLKRQLLDIYRFVHPEQVFVTGTPQFDSHFQLENYWSREEFCRRVGADPRRPIVMYATGMPNHMPGEDQIVEAIGDTLNEMKEFGPPQLLVRVYAKDRSGRFEPLKHRRPDILFPAVPWEVNWLTPLPADLPLWTNTLRHSALGINVASTVSLELCMFDKPVINVGYNPPSVPEGELSYARYYRFDHYAPVVASGAVRVAGSLTEMRGMIRDALAHPETGRAERAALLHSFFADTLDGRSGERVANVLLDLARRNGLNAPSPQRMGRGPG
jgi:hypothetical protein